MNLDNYNCVTLHALKKQGDEKIFLLSDDMESVNLACRAYNKIATMQGENVLFYVTAINAYLKPKKK